jgi:predicted RNase H-like HicB family nuclease
MKKKFEVIIEQSEGCFIARCPDIPGANGRGVTTAEVIQSLKRAIELIFEDRREDGLGGVSLPA